MGAKILNKLEIEVTCSFCNTVTIKPSSSYLLNKIGNGDQHFYCDKKCHKMALRSGKPLKKVLTDNEIETLVKKYRAKLVADNLKAIEFNESADPNAEPISKNKSKKEFDKLETSTLLPHGKKSNPKKVDNWELIGSSPARNFFINVLKRYFGSRKIKIKGEKLYTDGQLRNNYRVIYKHDRFRLERKTN